MAAVSFFGVLFPLSFLLVYGTIALGIWEQDDKYFELRKRPSTIGQSSLTYFQQNFYLVFIASIFINLFIQAYLNYNFYANDFLTSGIFVLSFMISMIIVIYLKTSYFGWNAVF